MLQLKNNTPFKAAIAVFPNEKAIDTLYLTIKATFSLGQKIEIAAEQAPIIMADEYWGEPGKSSLKYASELHLTKPATDVVMIGRAYAPGGKPVSQIDVLLQVGSLKEVIRVFGDRRWIRIGEAFHVSSPVPFETMPIVYERAYGGIHEGNGGRQVIFEPRNPVGKGFRGKRGDEEMHNFPLPNLEDPTQLITTPDDRPQPVCFGYVAPSWEPRRAFAGTYDDAWVKERAPYLPADFNNRYFSAAPIGMVADGYLQGGEPVTTTNVSTRGPLAFKLPVCEFDASVDIAGSTEKPILNLETVIIEPDENRLCLVWRASVKCDKKALKVRQVDVGLKKLMTNGLES